MFESRSFESAGLTLHALACPAPELPALVMVHGYMDHGGTFAHMAERLRRSHELLLLDRRGYGSSSRLVTGSYLFPDHILDLAAVIDGLGRERVSLCGHSVGGLIAAGYAACFPERVERLVLLDPFPILGAQAEYRDRLRDWIKGLRADPPKQMRRYASIEEARNRLRKAHKAIPDDVFEGWSERGVEGSTADGFRFAADPRHRVRGPIMVLEPSVISLVAKIEAPSLVVRGAESIVREFPSWLDAIPQLTRATVEGCGHMLHLERPVEVLDEMTRFLTSS